MTTTVFTIVLIAAAIHAAWNALIKSSGDKYSATVGLAIGQVPFALGTLLFVPLPNWNCWPYLFAGTVLHVVYYLLLQRSYQTGELTQIYPIARGSAPLLTAVLATVFVGEHLGPTGWLAIGLIVIGLMSLVSVRRLDGIWNNSAAGLALVTGGFTAAYSVVDGIGARVAGTGFGFFAFLAMANAAVLVAVTEARNAGATPRIVRERLKPSILAGGASYAAFGIVIWAMTHAPIALVAALRETSVIFALVIGVGVLKETLNLRKLAATFMTASGVLLLRSAR
jgi:drug/metabolite transporter (DMT)-like permease